MVDLRKDETNGDCLVHDRCIVERNLDAHTCDDSAVAMSICQPSNIDGDDNSRHERCELRICDPGQLLALHMRKLDM